MIVVVKLAMMLKMRRATFAKWLSNKRGKMKD
jgi:hypothetical protein